MPVIPALEAGGKGYIQSSKASLVYVRPCLKQTKTGPYVHSTLLTVRLRENSVPWGTDKMAERIFI